MSVGQESVVRDFSNLKSKQREIRAEFPENLGLRVHRALSWLDRAEQAEGDDDASFVFHWIVFNAAYADDRVEFAPVGERSNFADYFDKLIAQDSERLIYAAIWDRFPGPIRLLLDNKFVFQPFWSHHNGIAGFDDWQERFERSKKASQSALGRQDTKRILCTLFDRLYVLRNQLVHGGATWNSGVNREQVRDGSRILSFLVPLFIDLMMDNPDIDWGAPFYPVVD